MFLYKHTRTHPEEVVITREIEENEAEKQKHYINVRRLESIS